MSNILTFRSHCCGCGECSVVCPQNAIQMMPSEKGFLYPQIDTHKCIDCSLCVNACSFNQSYETSRCVQKAYAVKHKEETVRAKARSGGIFTALSDEIFGKNGVVYGCVLQDSRVAIHRRAVDSADTECFHGSKYIQSRITDCFLAVKKDLTEGKWVLFSGTACQTNAVRHYCKDIDCSRLLLIDIVCHGVPSSRIWKDYIDWVEQKTGKKVIAADFRDKHNFGWEAHVETFAFEDGTSFSCDYFKELFYSHLILREDCFCCPYKNLDRTGDITLADCWGIKANAPDFNDDKGVSLVLVNTRKGNEFFQAVEKQLNYRSVDVKNYLQPPLEKNWDKPVKYDQFWTDYEKNGFSDIYHRYMEQQRNGNHDRTDKIGVLTFHFAHNCGAVLQAYALVKTIQKYRNCEIINYQPDYHASWGNYRYHYEYPPRRIREILHSHGSAVKGAISVAYNLPAIMTNPVYRRDKKRTKVYEDFLKKHLPMSSVLHWRDETIQYTERHYDTVVTGSDQVWNPRIYGGGLDDIYLLPFSEYLAKYSYAASAGGDWTEEDAAKMALYLNHFSGISVREPDLQEALIKRNTYGRIDVDPSLLLKKEEYYSLEQKVRLEGEFVFVYAFHISEDLLTVLRFLKQKWNCTFVTYPFRGELKKQLEFDVLELDPMGPGEFLWLMHHAKYVVTSTFHGLAYATVYDKEFVCLEPEHGISRINHFLEMGHIHDHYFRGTEHLIYETDYNEFHCLIDERRMESMDYIRKICNKE